MTDHVDLPSPSTTSGLHPGLLLGRDREVARLLDLLDRARSGHSGALVLRGEAGIGKTALLDRLAAAAASGVRLERAVASEAEVGLAYAGLQMLCAHLMAPSADLPGPQREALEAAFALRDAGPPDPLVLALAVHALLRHAAGEGALLCLVDDAQWLDAPSAHALAAVARRLSTDRIALVLSTRGADPRFDDLPHLVVAGLGDQDARTLLDRTLPGGIDPRVRDQLLVESQGNPLALRELPQALSPADLAGGFALAGSIPLEHRIEQSLMTRLELLPSSTRTLLLLAAADPTGDPGLLWRAGAALGLGPEDLDAARHADALVVAGRVRFRHPLIRSAVYRNGTPADRRAVHAALADATYHDRDPDRCAWHRASAAVGPSEEVAAALVQSAERARTRGGAAAAAAFLERSAELTPDPNLRVARLLAAADAKQDAGATEGSLRLLGLLRDLALAPHQEALVGRLRARAGYALRRDRGALRQLLQAAQDLEPHDPDLARDTYLQALTAAVYAGRLAEPGSMQEITTAILAATADDRTESASDLALRGQALLAGQGPAAAMATARRAIRAFLDEPIGPRDLQWMWLGGRMAQDIWDAEGLRTLAERQVELARSQGVLTVLPMALNLLMVVRTFDGHLDQAEAICDDIDTILQVTGHPLPLYGRTFIAAYRGHIEEVERYTGQLRADAAARGEGYALTVANLAEALAYNGAGRYNDALASARAELPYAHELGHAMRTLLELVEAASRTGEHAIAAEAVQRLTDLTAPAAGSVWADSVTNLARAQLHDGPEVEHLYRLASDGFERLRVPMLQGRTQLLHGEMLRRQGRRVEARTHLRAAHQLLQASGMTGFAERAERELKATGERVQTRAAGATALTDQERNVARLARDGLTNREIGERLFISGHTAEWHLRKVFTKLGIKSRADLRTTPLDEPPARHQSD